MNLVARFVQPPAPGPLRADVMRLEEKPLPELVDGDILARNVYLSIDAGSRAQFDDRSDYAFKASRGKVPGSSGAVAEVVASRHPGWQVGDLLVTTQARWQLYQQLKPATHTGLAKVDPSAGPLAMHLGALGMVGFTAYIGIFEIGKPRAGETVVVSAAAGATGSLAGQFAKIAGARVVGIAGGPEKCAFVKEQLGFDDCIDYKQGDIASNLARACPEGIDVYYENVGGEIQKAVFAHMNDFGRVVMCGQVGQYSGAGAAPGPNLMVVVLKRLTLRGFMAQDHLERHGAFMKEASAWYQQGLLQHHVTVTHGLNNLHEAVNSLISGHNIGKQLCQVSDEPDWLR